MMVAISCEAVARSLVRPAAALALAGALVAATPSLAQQGLEEARSVSDLGMPSGPQTVRFSDRQRDGAGKGAAAELLPFTEWAKTFPEQKELLALHPGYVEPTVTSNVNGLAKTKLEKLQVYVAGARLVLDRPPQSVDLGRLTTHEALAKIDPAITHKPLAAAEAFPTRDPDMAYNRRPDRAWCTGPRTTCWESRYQLEGKLPLGIKLANKLEDGTKKVADNVTFQSEMRVATPDPDGGAAAAKLTGLAQPVVSELDQTIFHVNQIIRFGKLVAIVQPMPDAPQRSVVSLYLSLALKADVLDRKKEFERVPVLRNLVPAEVLMGRSSFNTGSSLSAGVPVYARSRIRTIAELLAKG